MQKVKMKTNMLPHQNLSKSSHHFKKLRSFSSKNSEIWRINWDSLQLYVMSTTPWVGFLVDPIFDSKRLEAEIFPEARLNKVSSLWLTQNSWPILSALPCFLLHFHRWREMTILPYFSFFFIEHPSFPSHLSNLTSNFHGKSSSPPPASLSHI